jgi:membrane protein
MASTEQSDKKNYIGILKKTATKFFADDCMNMAAAMAYYTIFSLPPLLVIVITIGSVMFDRQQVESAIESQMQGVMDAQQIDSMTDRVKDTGSGKVASIVGVTLLLFAATGVLAQLQSALNRVWDVDPETQAGGIKQFFMKRLFSFLMIIVMACILLVSLVLTSFLSGVGGYVSELLPGQLWRPVLMTLNLLLTWLIFALLFASVFKILPDAEVGWKDVAIGSAVTSLLFMTGQFLLSLYFSNADVTSPYGAAGSILLVLVWVYYSAIILLLGAEFTRVTFSDAGELQGELRPSS